MDIEECANNSIPDVEIKDNLENENGYPNEGNEQKQEFWLWRMLKSETGEGSISSYAHHPLNKDDNDYVGQIIRGFTGMLGNLNFAILDILLGSMGFIKDKKSTVNDVEYEESKPTIVNGRMNV